LGFHGDTRLEVNVKMHGHACQGSDRSIGLFPPLIPPPKEQAAGAADIPTDEARWAHTAEKRIQTFACILEQIPGLAEIPYTDRKQHILSGGKSDLAGECPVYC
jgi:hypothetical protein